MTTDAPSIAGRRAPSAASHREGEALPQLPMVVRASVCAGGSTTPYLRAGAGDLIVLLGASFVTPEPDSLVSVLARSHRVVVPDFPRTESVDGAATVAFSSRLRSFLDGLGADEVSIVARDDVALAALAFTLTDPDRVRRLALIVRDAPDPLDTGEPLADRLAEARCELLVVREPPERRSHNGSDTQGEAIARFFAS
jgi:pimeloyl-ACP methyl ester carboxylesterase